MFAIHPTRRLGRYLDLDVGDDVVGIAALRRIKATGVRRHQLGLILDGGTSAPLGFTPQRTFHNGRDVGKTTNCVWSSKPGCST